MTDVQATRFRGEPAPKDWARLVAASPAVASRTAREFADLFAAARAFVRLKLPADSMEKRGSLAALDEAEELAVRAACEARECPCS